MILALLDSISVKILLFFNFNWASEINFFNKIILKIVKRHLER
jgi:hypothetical protein